MHLNNRLFPPLPPGVDLKHPEIQNWRLDRIEEVVEHHHSSKIDKPTKAQMSWAPLILVVICAILGLTGHVSPGVVLSALRLLGH